MDGKMYIKLVWIALAVILTSSSCGGFTRRLNPPTPQPPAPTIPPTAQAEPTSTPGYTPDLTAVPAPVLIRDGWLDRSTYASGLVLGAQWVLKTHFDWSVYHILVDISDDYQSVTLKEEVLYTNKETKDLSHVIMRMYPALFGANVKYSTFKINGNETQPEIRGNDSIIDFSLPSALKPGQSVVLSLDLEIAMPSDPSGNYQVFGYVDNIITLAHFYPMIAVYDSNGWHEEIPPSYGDVVYSDTSYYLVDLTLPQNAEIVSSGFIREQIRNGMNRKTVMLVGGPMRDFFIASGTGLQRLESSQKVGETTIYSVASPNDEQGNEKALDTATQAIMIFNKEIGQYPYTEFKVLETSTTALGVEYPGLTVINRSIYQPGNRSNSVPNSVYLESTVAHEVGHQWFYGVLGDDQVNQPWLDESLVQYITGMYFTDRYGKASGDNYQDSWYSRWDQVKMQEIPIGMPVKYYDPQSYGAIVYGRGPLFFAALSADMGKQDFSKFLKDYYQENMWVNVTGDILKKTAEASCSCDLEKLFEKWVHPR